MEGHVGSSVDPRLIEGADILLRDCGRSKRGETVLILCDPDTIQLAEILESRAKLITPHVTVMEIPPLDMHGEEPPPIVATPMGLADLCIGITSKSMAHTKTRSQAAAKGMRYLSLPDYSMGLLADESLRVDFQRQATVTRAIADIFTNGSLVRVTSGAGTHVTLRIDGRSGNCCPGYVEGPGELGSPPDIEANVSPIESSAEGVVVVDGSIPYPGVGLLEHPLRLAVEKGSIVDIEGDESIVSIVKKIFEMPRSPKTHVLAECGVGLNEKAVLCGSMLIDEGAAGTMHFGFGSNNTVGGLNDVPFHLDCVFRKPSLEVDGVSILDEGGLSESLLQVAGEQQLDGGVMMSGRRG